jgi:hypothetical protein
MRMEKGGPNPEQKGKKASGEKRERIDWGSGAGTPITREPAGCPLVHTCTLYRCISNLCIEVFGVVNNNIQLYIRLNPYYYLHLLYRSFVQSLL